MPLCRFIVMEADSEINAWTCICVSQADCILLIGAEDAAPSVSSRLTLCLLPALNTKQSSDTILSRGNSTPKVDNNASPVSTERLNRRCNAKNPYKPSFTLKPFLPS